MKKNIHYALTFLTFLLLSIEISYSQIWVRVNGPYGSTINTIAFNSNGHLYFGANGNNNTEGFIKTTDYGLNWTVAYDYAAVFSSTIMPNNTIILSAAMQGVVYSTNDGNSWNLSNLSGATSFCSTSNNYAFAGGNFSGIYRTTNNGSNWIRVNFDNYNFRAFGRTQNDLIYSGSTANGIFKSSNYGNNWINVWNTNYPISCLSTRLTGIILAGTPRNGLYISSLNNDTNWTRMITPFDSIYALTVTGADKIFVGCEKGIYWSSNIGVTWYFSDSDFVKDIRNLASNDVNHVFAGTENGIFMSSNSGLNWSNIGLNRNTADILEVSQNGSIFAVTITSPIRYLWRSSDNGFTWFREYKTNVGVRSLRADYFNNLYMATTNGMYYSTNNGENWTFKGLAGSSVNFIRINSNGHIFAGCTNSLFRSTNNGNNWIDIKPEIASFVSMAFDNIANIYLGTARPSSGSSKIWKSTNNGNNWILLYQPTTPSDISELECKSNGYIFACAYGMFRSTNGGNNWSQMNNFTTTDMKINSVGTIFFNAGTVYKSTNNLESFELFNTGLGQLSIKTFAVSPSDYLFGTTDINGVFRTMLPTNVLAKSSQIPFETQIVNNYPNPFNPATKIKFDIAAGIKTEGQNVNLTVYNVLGKEIAVLVNEDLKPGSYEVDWDASNYSGGIYFARLTAGEYEKTIKMVFTK